MCITRIYYIFEAEKYADKGQIERQRKRDRDSKRAEQVKNDLDKIKCIDPNIHLAKFCAEHTECFQKNGLFCCSKIGRIRESPTQHNLIVFEQLLKAGAYLTHSQYNSGNNCQFAGYCAHTYEQPCISAKFPIHRLFI